MGDTFNLSHLKAKSQLKCSLCETDLIMALEKYFLFLQLLICQFKCQLCQHDWFRLLCRKALDRLCQ